MPHQFKDHFSKVAKGYRAFRPEYPEELFRWLADIAPKREAALDCGCGTGQAAVALARYFDRVFAIDPSAEQVANAIVDPKVVYSVAPAEATGLPAQSQDLIIAAQALHWFDLDRFYPELRRVARKNAVFAAFTYGLLTVNEEVDAVIASLYRPILGEYWPPERRHVDSAYRTLSFPLKEIAAPGYQMTANWDFGHLLGYLATWSAVKEYKLRKGEDPLQPVEADLRRAWGEDRETRDVSWPLVIRAGIVY